MQNVLSYVSPCAWLDWCTGNSIDGTDAQQQEKVRSSYWIAMKVANLSSCVSALFFDYMPQTEAEAKIFNNNLSSRVQIIDLANLSNPSAATILFTKIGFTFEQLNEAFVASKEEEANKEKLDILVGKLYHGQRKFDVIEYYNSQATRQIEPADATFANELMARMVNQRLVDIEDFRLSDLLFNPGHSIQMIQAKASSSEEARDALRKRMVDKFILQYEKASDEEKEILKPQMEQVYSADILPFKEILDAADLQKSTYLISACGFKWFKTS